MAGGTHARLALVALGTVAVALDTALNIAFPAMTAHFGLALPAIQWVPVCYMLAFGSLMLGAGRLGDILGHGPVFRIGLGVTALGQALCAAAPSYPLLLGGRAVQGVGAALVIGCGPALVTGLYPEALRPRLLGVYALVFAVGAVLGPSLGALALQAWGWPAVFWTRAPLALLPMLLLRGLPAPPRDGGREPFDLPGALLLVLAIIALLLAVNQARYLAQGAALPLAALAAASFWGFLRRSRRVPHPIMDLSHFRRPGFARLNAANALVNLAGFAVLLLVPYHLTGPAGLPTLAAGLVLAAAPGGTALAAAPAGWLLARLPPWRMVQAGAACTALGLGLVALWDAATPVAAMVACLLLAGIGQGLVQVAYAEIILTTLPRHQRGVAGSLTMMTRTLGIVAGAMLLALWFESWAPPFERGFAATFVFAAATSGAALLMLRRP
ncbi:MFS transporter [Paracraurococcus ruber]|nr:MFS transporter [Paracraurococcus ruber]